MKRLTYPEAAAAEIACWRVPEAERQWMLLVCVFVRLRMRGQNPDTIMRPVLNDAELENGSDQPPARG